MKISEIEIDMVKLYLKIDFTEDDVLLQLIIDSAKGYLKTYTGLEDAVLDTKEDLTLAVLTLVADMYENRGFTVEEMGKTNKINKIIDSMLGLYSINLL